MKRWSLIAGVTLIALVALPACSPSEPLSAEEEAFCALMDEDRLDVFPEDVAGMSPTEFEAAQRSQSDTFVAALEVAPADLRDTIEWVVGQFEAINAVYEDIEWDLTRADEIDPALLAVVAVEYPETEAEARYGELDAWIQRRC